VTDNGQAPVSFGPHGAVVATAPLGANGDQVVEATVYLEPVASLSQHASS